MSPFEPSINVQKDAQIIFVADLFIDEYVGGAELTSEALIKSSQYKVQKLHSRDVSIEVIRQGVKKHWVFGNFSGLNPALIPTIVSQTSYSVLEYDYKYCSFRSPEKHAHESGKPCDCHQSNWGKHISAFFHGAKTLWFMSEAQKRRYTTLFPFLDKPTTTVLSSVFDDETLDRLRELRLQDVHRDEQWITLGSPSWVKGERAARDWCLQNNVPCVTLWNEPYDNVLKSLRASKGFVYLPLGADTCPRMTIEAKLLGCDLVLNENVQHANEDWFATDDLNAIDEYLRGAKTLFWNGIKDAIERRPSISGYITTYNCVQQQYPFIESIKSMLGFCDEVCVVDGGSKDGTLERLTKLARPEATDADLNECVDRLLEGKEELVGNKLRVKVVKRNWRNPRFALFDGMQKAEARAMCKGEFCWQMDSDEIVHEEDAQKVIDLCDRFPSEVDIISLPVIEYWGGTGKVRIDITPWKWRLSKNKSHITHGVPASLRRYDDKGEMYAAVGTDGCCMIHTVTGEPLQHASFYTQEMHQHRIQALNGDEHSLRRYELMFNDIVKALPSVHHYSWTNIERKIRLYRNYWTSHWASLYGQTYIDTAETNMMFDVPWSQVTDEMISSRAKELEATGGHIWHTKWNGKITPHMTVRRSEPSIMKGNS